MKFKKLSASAKEILLIRAKQEAKQLLAIEVLAEHIALAILKKNPPVINTIFLKHSIKISSILAFFEELIDRPSPSTPPYPIIKEPIYGEEITTLLEQASIEAQHFNSSQIQEEHLFLAILTDTESSLLQCVSKFPITNDEFRIALNNLTLHSDQKANNSPTTSTLNKDFLKICTSLNERIKHKVTMTISERDSEILQIIQILKRQTKNNPLLLGNAGVGKTAIVEALAHQINQKESPEFLHNVEIFELHVASLLAGTRYRGDFEERLSSLIQTFEENPNFILFIDEIHLIAGAGSSSEGALDLANILKPALARGSIKCIGATTYSEYQQYLQRDSALDRRFQHINISEPTLDQMTYILEATKHYYEANHRVIYTPAILNYIIHLSKIHFPNRLMPDKALDLMDEVGVYKSLSKYRLKTQLTQTERSLHQLYEALQQHQNNSSPQHHKQLFVYNQLRKDYEYLYHQWQNINTKEDLKCITLEDIFLTLSDKLKVHSYFFHQTKEFFPQNLLNKLNKSIAGHQQTLQCLIPTYVEAFHKHYFQSKPLLSLLFIGPDAVGKQSVMREVHALSHKDNNGFFYVNLSHINNISHLKELFYDQHHSGLSNSKNILQVLKTQPQLTIYFDNIEQAHPDFYPYLKSMLNDATIIGSSGTPYYLYNTIIILATSLLNQQAKSSFHLNEEKPQAENTQGIDDFLSHHLQGYLSSLIDHVYYFHSLSQLDMKKLFAIQWSKLQELIQPHHDYAIIFTPLLEEQLIQKSKAQPHTLLRLFEQQIKRPLLHSLAQLHTTCQKKQIIVHYDPEKESILLEEKEQTTTWQNA